MKTAIRILSPFALVTVAIPLAATSPAAFLNDGFGANAIALGGNAAAFTKDAGALYWNPAGLANITGERTKVRKIDAGSEAERAFTEDPDFRDLAGDSGSPSETAVVTRGFEAQTYASAALLGGDRQVGFAGAAFTALKGTFGVGMLANRVTGMDSYNAAGTKTGALDHGAYAAYLGYGWGQGPIRLGVSFAGIQENLGGKAISGGGLNVGIQATPIPILSAGVCIQNLVGAMQRNAAASGEFRKLDTLLRFSLSVSSPPPNSNLKLLLGFTANLDDPKATGRDGGFTPNLGVAMGLTTWSYVMVGMERNRPAFGLGVSFKRIQAAYGMNRDILTGGMQHYVDLNLVF